MDQIYIQYRAYIRRDVLHQVKILAAIQDITFLAIINELLQEGLTIRARLGRPGATTQEVLQLLGLEPSSFITLPPEVTQEEAARIRLGLGDPDYVIVPAELPPAVRPLTNDEYAKITRRDE